MTVTKRTRYEVLRRDNHTCRYCGAKAPTVALHVDHVIPVALGGGDKPDNLVAACKDCNAGKSSSSPDATLVADVADDAVRWANAMKAAAQAKAKRKDVVTKYVNTVDEAWNYWGLGRGKNRKPVPRPVDWEGSVRRWCELGLPASEIAEAIDIAAKRCMSGQVDPVEMWRYTCGICWSKLTELQDEARAIVASTGA